MYCKTEFDVQKQEKHTVSSTYEQSTPGIPKLVNMQSVRCLEQILLG